MEAAKANSSAVAVASQMPFVWNKRGKVRMATVWNRKVRRKEMVAETMPLFKAVKKAEENTLIPISAKVTAYKRKPCTVRFIRVWSYPTNSFEKGTAPQKETMAIITPPTVITVRLFL